VVCIIQNFVLLIYPLISVLGLQERLYRVSVLALKEGTSEVVLRFEKRSQLNEIGKNDESEKKKPQSARNSYHQTISSQLSSPVEYSFYKISITSTPPKNTEPILLSTSVRTPVVHKLTITNPSTTVAHFSSSCAHSAVSVPPLIDVPALSSTTIEISFVPLDVVDTNVPLTFTSIQLGKLDYTLHLVSVSVPSEKTIKFRTSLGTDQMLTFRFINRYTQSVDFKIAISSDSPNLNPFSVQSNTVFSPAALSSSSGIEVSIPITFEPTALGMFRATLTASSDKAGTYTCILIGHSTDPTPQGPVIIRSGSAGNFISIRNIFSQQTIFTFVVDNPAFQVKANENIPPKKSANINIQFKPTTQSSTPISGKLTVSCSLVPCSWIYYLKGI
jgi:hypothetical protein